MKFTEALEYYPLRTGIEYLGYSAEHIGNLFQINRGEHIISMSETCTKEQLSNACDELYEIARKDILRDLSDNS